MNKYIFVNEPDLYYDIIQSKKIKDAIQNNEIVEGMIPEQIATVVANRMKKVFEKDFERVIQQLNKNKTKETKNISGHMSF